MQMTQFTSGQSAVVGKPVIARAATKLHALAAAVWLSSSRRRQWRALMDLDDHLLRDIGITRSQAVEEATGAFRFFRAPLRIGELPEDIV